MAHAQKLDFMFRQNEWVHLNRWGRQFSRLLAAEVCASAVVMLDTPWSEVVWSVLTTHSIRQFLLYFPSLASPCAITFQLDSTWNYSFSYTKRPYDVLRIKNPLTYFVYSEVTKYNIGGIFAGYYGGDASLTPASQFTYSPELLSIAGN